MRVVYSEGLVAVAYFTTIVPLCFDESAIVTVNLYVPFPDILTPEVFVIISLSTLVIFTPSTVGIVILCSTSVTLAIDAVATSVITLSANTFNCG